MRLKGRWFLTSEVFVFSTTVCMSASLSFWRAFPPTCSSCCYSCRHGVLDRDYLRLWNHNRKCTSAGSLSSVWLSCTTPTPSHCVLPFPFRRRRTLNGGFWLTTRVMSCTLSTLSSSRPRSDMYRMAPGLTKGETLSEGSYIIDFIDSLLSTD